MLASIRPSGPYNGAPASPNTADAAFRPPDPPGTLPGAGPRRGPARAARPPGGRPGRDPRRAPDPGRLARLSPRSGSRQRYPGLREARIGRARGRRAAAFASGGPAARRGHRREDPELSLALGTCRTCAARARDRARRAGRRHPATDYPGLHRAELQPARDGSPGARLHDRGRGRGAGPRGREEAGRLAAPRRLRRPRGERPRCDRLLERLGGTRIGPSGRRGRSAAQGAHPRRLAPLPPGDGSLARDSRPDSGTGRRPGGETRRETRVPPAGHPARGKDRRRDPELPVVERRRGTARGRLGRGGRRPGPGHDLGPLADLQ